jgi:hypothetical protein
MEGKAVMFEKLAYPDYSLTKVNYSINKDYWGKIEQDLDKVDPKSYTTRENTYYRRS